MRLKLGMSMLVIAVLTSCGSAVATAPTPPATVEVTRVVTRVVTQVVTQVVTPTPLPTAVPRPTLPATATPNVLSPTPGPSPLPTIAGNWTIDRSKSSFDDSQTMVLRLDAEQDISNDLRTERPTLIARCAEKTLDVYIIVGLAPDVEYGMYDESTVRLRIDKEPAETVIASQSTDQEALFLPKPRTTIKRLMAAETLLFSYTPFQQTPVEITFDVRKLDTIVDELLALCPAA